MKMCDLYGACTNKLTTLITLAMSSQQTIFSSSFSPNLWFGSIKVSMDFLSSYLPLREDIGYIFIEK